MKKLLNLVASAMEEYGKLMDAYGITQIRSK